MGIHLWSDTLRRLLTSSIVPAVTLLAANSVCASAGEPQVRNNELICAIKTLNALIERRIRTSKTYPALGRIMPFDIDDSIDLRAQRTTAPQTQFERHFRRLTFYAVCKKNKIALTKVYEIDRLFIPPLFDEAEEIYLEWLSHRLGLNLQFHGVLRERGRGPSHDLTRINRLRRVTGALADSAPKEALLSLASFSRLCAIG